MIKALRFFQYAYLVIAIILVVEAVTEWSADRNRAYFLLFFAALAVFLFFFRKHYRKKFQDRQQK